MRPKGMGMGYNDYEEHKLVQEEKPAEKPAEKACTTGATVCCTGSTLPHCHLLHPSLECLIHVSCKKCLTLSDCFSPSICSWDGLAGGLPSGDIKSDCRVLGDAMRASDRLELGD